MINNQYIYWFYYAIPEFALILESCVRVTCQLKYCPFNNKKTCFKYSDRAFHEVFFIDLWGIVTNIKVQVKFSLKIEECLLSPVSI